MLLSLLIILVLIVGVYTGIKRGLLHQLVMTIGFALSYWIATTYYDRVLYYVELTVPYPSPFLPEDNPFAFYNMDLLFEMDQAYYHILSLITIFFAGWLITRFVGRLLKFLMDVKINQALSDIGGAVLSFINHYIGVFFILLFLSVIPIDAIQNSFSNSWLGETIVTSSPYLSNSAYEKLIREPIEANEPSDE